MGIRFVNGASLGVLLLVSFAAPTLVSAQAGSTGVPLAPTAETLQESAFPQRPYSPYAGRCGCRRRG